MHYINLNHSLGTKFTNTMIDVFADDAITDFLVIAFQSISKLLYYTVILYYTVSP